jgi:thiamine-phosphate pyrophosphorylase
MWRYYITGGTENVVEYIRRAIDDSVEYIQIREKHLNARALFHLVSQAVQAAESTSTRILVNTRADIAIAAGAHGVHLPANSIAPRLLRSIAPPEFIIGVSCHTLDEITRAHQESADFAVFGPIFDTPGKGPALGLDALHAACAATKLPILALGGITWQNASLCIEAGAAGIAGIRLFQESQPRDESPANSTPESDRVSAKQRLPPPPSQR